MYLSGNYLRSIVLVFIVFLFTSILSAQIIDLMDDEVVVESQNARVRTDEKSASAAILLSTIFPGSGHFYVNKKTAGTYVFPVLEIVFWAGIIYLDNKGHSIEDDYMRYADAHYDRVKQHKAEKSMMDNESASDLYRNSHFRLDDANTQHFYEDIGKYNKYIFGWDDWYAKYAHNDAINWAFDNDGIWIGNVSTNPDYPSEVHDKPNSKNRLKYIKMRRDAQENFDNRTFLSFGVALNRVVSVLDVLRVTRNYNYELRYASSYEFSLTPQIVENKLTPTLNLTKKF